MSILQLRSPPGMTVFVRDIIWSADASSSIISSSLYSGLNYVPMNVPNFVSTTRMLSDLWISLKGDSLAF